MAISNKNKRLFDWFHSDYIRNYHQNKNDVGPYNKTTYKLAREDLYFATEDLFVANVNILESQIIKELYGN